MSDLENTGERMIPEVHKGSNKYGAHLIRYHATLPFIKDKTVLDIACGTGYGSQLMAKAAKKVYGVDLAPESVAYAKKNYAAKNIEFKTGDAVAIPLEDKIVDVVVSFETVEHVPDYAKFLNEIKRVLKPGGVLIMSSPNSDTSLGGNEYHHKEFNLKEFTSLISKNFKNQEMYHQSLWLYNSLLPAKEQDRLWKGQLFTLKTAAASEKETEFYLAVASDNKIEDIVEPTGVISEYHRQQPSMKREVAKLKDSLKSAEKKLASMEKDRAQAVREAAALKKRLEAIEGSKAWALTRRLQRAAALRRPKS